MQYQAFLACQENLDVVYGSCSTRQEDSAQQGGAE
jgi:hypothetical protein